MRFAGYGTGEWNLFDLENDPGETKDLSKEKPELHSRLKSAWEKYGSIRVSQRELRPFQGRGWKPGNAIAGCQFGTDRQVNGHRA